MQRLGRFGVLAGRALVAWVTLLPVSQLPAEDAASVMRRLSRTSQYLSSDELGGRGLGTPGIELAAEYLADQFRQLPLETNLYDGTPFQEFQVTTGASLGEGNKLAFVPPAENGRGPAAEPLVLGEDFNPLAEGGEGSFALPLAFVGYGITAPEADYDDYADIDVRGKAVIVLRHEPQQDNPHSAFNGTHHSEHAPFRRKISNAFQHGAKAVIFCTCEHDIRTRVAQWEKRRDAAVAELAAVHAAFAGLDHRSAEDLAEYRDQTTRLARKISEYADQCEAERDPLLEFTAAGEGSQSREIPVLHCRREVVDRVLQASGHDTLSVIEQRIDKTLKPESFHLDGWQAEGHVAIDRELVTVKNVVAVLEGEGPRAEETIIIGAHYDHLGRGGEGSAAPGSTEIHNGADDNASGVAALLEVARALATRAEPLGRRVVFIAFTGEERGLLGSAEYARRPLFPLSDTVAMLNFDMVGRLDDNKLIVNGTATADEFDDWLDEVNERQAFELARSEGGYGPSDHSTFYAKNVPVMHFFTGSHTDYHRPSDDFQLLNIEGIHRVSQFVVDLTERIAESPDRPTYVEVAQQPLGDSRANPRPYFGSIPDFGHTDAGYAITGTTPQSPAAEAGLQSGDVIVRLGEYDVGNLEDFDGALRKYEAGDKVPVVVRRGDRQLTLEVTLDPPR